ncbi:FKBP-type peptidyl-prolyl cis-trans isomerase [Owenweeksia hongkongensis]|uniref:FKBP-type peptidyl-prolyl cis-trans isomerase n=1 Tax=Owenweeksia hongkongensis TaxID=253245 RepID=UPI003A8E5F3C
MRISIYLFIVGFAAISCQCSSKQSKGEDHEQRPMTEDEQVEVQRDFLRKERESIDAYIKDRNLKVERTGLGMYYTILVDSSAIEMVETEDIVEYEYDISMLNGSLLFTSRQLGNGHIKIDKQDAEIGLHESLKKLGLGDKGLFILPSHLAFGVAGDQDRVPPKTALVYELKVVKIQKSKS